jgi:hypothetical protein
VARDIDRKLRVTAALLGVATCKDIGAAFRRVNPATVFDVSRAHKWLQGRSRPRDARIYTDWARVVDLGHPAAWIAECAFEEFVEAACARYGQDRDALLRLGESSRSAAADRTGESSFSIAGTYACYSHAWSPYFAGRLIRGELSIARHAGSQKLSANWAERLPTGAARLEGPVKLTGSGMYLDLREATGDARVFISLYAPTQPASVLAGLMCGATFIGPDAQPSVTRIVMVRLAGPSARLRTADAYLPAGASLAADLATLGARITDPGTVDERLAEFLTSGRGDGVDQISASAYRALVDVFDPLWLAQMSAAA